MSASPSLNLKPSSSSITDYYHDLDQLTVLGITNETAVRDAFQALLKPCCKQFDLTLVAGWKFARKGRLPIFVEGELTGLDQLARGYWEAKDEQDDLKNEIKETYRWLPDRQYHLPIPRSRTPHISRFSQSEYKTSHKRLHAQMFAAFLLDFLCKAMSRKASSRVRGHARTP